MTSQLHEFGHATLSTGISESTLAELRDRLFRGGKAGARCLLDDPLVQTVALALRVELTRAGVLPAAAVAMQAITFDKTAGVNWNVAWHQDLIFPFAQRVSSPDFTLPCLKDGIDFGRPPRPLLEEMLAVRLHLDVCGENNGPLRVSPGTHRFGVIGTSRIAELVTAHGEASCLANEGDVLLMRPLLLHASSKASAPAHRRVLHIVYHSGAPMPERWHRAVF